MFSCTPKGKMMSLDVAKKAIDLAEIYEFGITIGGGEPTLHPDLITIVGYCSLVSNYAPTLITNGTCDDNVWNILFRAHKNGRLQLGVSYSPWHDVAMINKTIYVDSDNSNLWWGGNPNGRHDNRIIVPKGRAKHNTEQLENEAYDFGYNNVRIDDDCRSVRVDPYGNVWADLEKENISCGELSEDNLHKAMDLVNEE